VQPGSDGRVTVPYLPDPLAQWAVFRGMPTADPKASLMLHFGAGEAWYDPLSIKLVLAYGAPGTAPVRKPDSIWAFLDYGEQKTVRLSSGLTAPNHETLAGLAVDGSGRGRHQ